VTEARRDQARSVTPANQLSTPAARTSAAGERAGEQAERLLELDIRGRQLAAAVIFSSTINAARLDEIIDQADRDIAERLRWLRARYPRTST
jgi:hypothetical protein